MLKSMNISNSILGLDIGSGLIKMVQIFQGENIMLQKYGCIENPAFNSVTPFNHMDNELSNTIKTCHKRYGFDTKKVSLCLCDPSIIFRDIRLPEMEDQEILENIKYEMSEYFSINIESYSIAYKILNKEQDQGHTVFRVLAAAAPKELIAGYVQIVKHAGLKLSYIDITANALSKIIKQSESFAAMPSNHAICILDYGHRSLDISIFEDGVPYVTRMVEIRNQQGLDTIILTLNQVLDYYYSRKYTSRVMEILLIGGNSYLNGFSQYLSQNINVKVVQPRPSMFSVTNHIHKEASLGIYLQAIGAAIREDL